MAKTFVDYYNLEEDVRKRMESAKSSASLPMAGLEASTS